jgi:tripartite-type tricarboxylate transporter receptor subunit TctC
MPVHLLRRLSLIAVSVLALTGVAAAQNYPDRVVRLINPFPPGGSVDITGRILAQKLSENLGHQVIVENHAGAGGNTGSDLVAKSEPDGYTLLFTAPGPLVTNEALYTKGLPFNPRKDFVPIAIFAFTPIVLMVTPSVPAKNVQELIAYAKAHPSAINFGSAGVGSTPHLSGELFKSMAKIDIVHVPYRGTGPAMSDLMGGHIQMMFDLLPGSLPQIEAGKVRALANAGAKRPAALPDLPTVAEQGLPGFDSASWVALAAPSKTPEAIVARLRSEVDKVINSSDIVKRLHELGSEPGTSSEQEVGAFLESETRKWAEVIRISGAKAD